jgi:general secretion pathway protein M
VRQHWRQRTVRERRVLVAGAVVLVGILAWVGVWEPLQHERAALRQQVSDNAVALAWLRPAVAAHEAGGAPAGADASLLARVDVAARAHGVQGQLSSIEPQGTQSIRLQFADVPFDAFARWLEALAVQGVAVHELSLQRSTGAGRVHARLELRDDGA